MNVMKSLAPPDKILDPPLTEKTPFLLFVINQYSAYRASRPTQATTKQCFRWCLSVRLSVNRKSF